MRLPFYGKNETVVGLEIGNNFLNVVELKRKDGAVYLKKMARVDLYESNLEEPNQLGEIIRNTMRSHNFNSKNVVLGLATKNVIIRQVNFPLMNEEELRETLKWESDRYLPLPPDDAIIDFHISEEKRVSEPSEMQVVLVGVKKSIIDCYLAIAEAAEIKLAAIEVTSFAFLRAIHADEIAGTVAVIMAGEMDSEMVIINDGLLRLSRVIVNSSIEDLFREIRRSIDFHMTQYRDEPIGKIILSGGYAEVQALRVMLETELNLSVKEVDPFRLIKPDPSFDPSYLAKQAPVLGVCIGLALREEK